MRDNVVVVVVGSLLCRYPIDSLAFLPVCQPLLHLVLKNSKVELTSFYSECINFRRNLIFSKLTFSTKFSQLL